MSSLRDRTPSLLKYVLWPLVVTLIGGLIVGTILLFMEYRSGLFSSSGNGPRSRESGQGNLTPGSEAVIVAPHGQAVIVFASATGGEIREPVVSERCVSNRDSSECLLALAELEVSDHPKVVDFLKAGTNVTILDGPVGNGQYQLWRVKARQISGWIVENYLSLPLGFTIVSPSPAPTPLVPTLSFTPISPGTSYNGTLSAGEVDEYSFIASSQEPVEIYVQPMDDLLFRLQIRYLNGEVIAETHSLAYSIFSYTGHLVFAPELGTEYIISVTGLTTDCSGSYVIGTSPP